MDPQSRWINYVSVRPFLVSPHGVFLDHVLAAAGFSFGRHRYALQLLTPRDVADPYSQTNEASWADHAFHGSERYLFGEQCQWSSSSHVSHIRIGYG